MKNDVKSEHGNIKRIFSLKDPLVCISFYLITTAFLLAFLKGSEYISIPALIYVFLLLVFPAFFGAYGCRVTRSVVATFIYFFVISFVYFLAGFAYTATQKKQYDSALSEVIFLVSMLSLECFVSAVITKISMKIKEKKNIADFSSTT